MRAGEYLSAHLTFLEAASAARFQGDFETYLIQMANAFNMGCRARLNSATRLRILVDIRSTMNAHPEALPTDLLVDFRSWVWREFFDYLLDNKPIRRNLEECISNMAGLSTADLLHQKSRLHAARGAHALALEAAERSWAEYDGSGTNLHAGAIILRAVHAHLDTKDSVAAEAWLQVARRRARADSCLNCEINAASAAVDVALARLAPVGEMYSILAEHESLARRAASLPQTHHSAVRVQLLDPILGDPGKSSHPARNMLTGRKPGDDRSPSRGYAHALMVLDFRLAALRYSAQLDPAEDLYYRYVPALPQRIVPNNRAEFARRLEKARTAMKWVMRYAVRLDTMLECTMRQDEVTARGGRIESLAERAKLGGVSGGSKTDEIGRFENRDVDGSRREGSQS
jgi:hypothetical protein